jgi:hypothetical protein
MKGDSCLSNAEFVHYWEIQQFSFAVALSLAKKKYIFNPRCMEKLIGRCSGFQLQCAILIFFGILPVEVLLILKHGILIFHCIMMHEIVIDLNVH